jgi:hypothetical protein
MLLNALKQTTKQNQRKKNKRKALKQTTRPEDKTSDELISDATFTLQQLKTLNAKMNKMCDSMTPRA